MCPNFHNLKMIEKIQIEFSLSFFFAYWVQLVIFNSKNLVY
jgi:hypothetical protein